MGSPSEALHARSRRHAGAAVPPLPPPAAAACRRQCAQRHACAPSMCYTTLKCFSKRVVASAEPCEPSLLGTSCARAVAPPTQACAPVRRIVNNALRRDNRRSVAGAARHQAPGSRPLCARLRRPGGTRCPGQATEGVHGVVSDGRDERLGTGGGSGGRRQAAPGPSPHSAPLAATLLQPGMP